MDDPDLPLQPNHAWSRCRYRGELCRRSFRICGVSELRCTSQSHAVAHVRAVNRNGRETAMNIQKMAERVKENIGQVIVGKDEVIELALVALLGES